MWGEMWRKRRSRETEEAGGGRVAEVEEAQTLMELAWEDEEEQNAWGDGGGGALLIIHAFCLRTESVIHHNEHEAVICAEMWHFIWALLF